MIKRSFVVGLAATSLAACAADPVSEPKALGSDRFVITYDPTAPRAPIEAKAREICMGRQWCQVMGWSDETLAPSAFPLTDREAAGQTFDYLINRANGVDQARWLR